MAEGCVDGTVVASRQEGDASWACHEEAPEVVHVQAQMHHRWEQEEDAEEDAEEDDGHRTRDTASVLDIRPGEGEGDPAGREEEDVADRHHSWADDRDWSREGARQRETASSRDAGTCPGADAGEQVLGAGVR